MELKEALLGIKGLSDTEKEDMLERSSDLQSDGMEQGEADQQVLSEIEADIMKDLEALNKKIKKR